MIKILTIVGSPRKANIYRLMKAMCDIAKEINVQADLIFLKDLHIDYCNGCLDYCNAKKECRIQDDMQILFTKLKQADAIIVGTPTYFWNVSGLLKNFMDRTLPLYITRELKGKIGVAVAMAEADGQNLAISNISSFFHLHKMKEIGSMAIARRTKKVKEEDIEMAKILVKTIVNELV